MPTEVQNPIESKMTDLDRAELAVVAEYAAEDRFIGADDTPWFPFAESLEVKVYRMDNRNGDYVIGLRSTAAAQLGRHRHRGPVSAVTIRGSWEYEEYDWVARPGDYVRENPGTIHTLQIHENTEILFHANGPFEFIAEDDTLTLTMDGWSFVNLLIEYCKAQGITFNDRIFY